MSHVSHMNESCLWYEWVMSLIWMSHVSHMKKACHTYEWGKDHQIDAPHKHAQPTHTHKHTHTHTHTHTSSPVRRSTIFSSLRAMSPILPRTSHVTHTDSVTNESCHERIMLRMWPCFPLSAPILPRTSHAPCTNSVAIGSCHKYDYSLLYLRQFCQGLISTHTHIHTHTHTHTHVRK